MSTALAVAAATEAIRRLLEEWLAGADIDAAVGGGHATVSAVPPDQLTLSGTGAKLGLNVFLHRLSLNQGWRNVELPSYDANGTKTANPPLAVDLHFMLSAYGAGQLHPEKLLGHGMEALHQHPVLTREQLAALLPTDLAAAGLATQVELLRIAPESITGEEASRLWSALQAKYRPSFYYSASVVLIETPAPVRSALPVLVRGGRLPGGAEAGVAVAADLRPRFPTLVALQPAAGQQVVEAGGTVTVTGELLAGTSRIVHLVDQRRAVVVEVDVGAGANAQVLSFGVPATLPVGTYDVTVEVRPDPTSPASTTNRLPLVVAPHIVTAFPIAVTRDAGGDVTLSIACSPGVFPDQQVSLILGTREVPARPHPAPATTSLQFVVRDAPAGSHLTRLRVDGIDSAVVDRAVSPPVFLDRRVVIS
ncbi:DUF4255 domain-containing protein [Nocardioides sp. cx-173]|uniref:DUF4255 domain-containing protein n=1 Tax=Nocardioides sp. cx-173 TaxID=2898796 RepID=UPI001E4D667A|nr:DUF4255 domain-containing protein [Nocardioides sp. cx-173]MCD4525963.1 DUF4255 domain-containing protein [Nocardioides sp. cx-173]UGB43660.1 DUF4255 domain-containing protein [Nocardioides sp. cx-173]